MINYNGKEMRNERGEVITNRYYRNTKDYKRLLQTVVCQQTGQPRRNRYILESYNLSKLNNDEIENLNRLIQ